MMIMRMSPDASARLRVHFRRTRKPALTLCLFLLLHFLGHGTISVAAPPDPAERRLQLLQQRYEKVREQFCKEMIALAETVEAQSYFRDADFIRKRALSPHEGAYNLDDLPEEKLPQISLAIPDAERQWRLKHRKLETDYANELYKIARDALNKGYPSLVFQLIREVAFYSPDHINARRMLGYVQDGGKWTTSFRKQMALEKNVDHPRFGWIPQKYVARYENGERLLDGEWVSAEKEAAIRRDFNYAWVIGSEHFLVKTNHSLEKGVEISRALEKFHDFFLREFTGFFSSPQQIQRLLDSGPRAKWSPAARYQVYYYRNKDEFVEALKSRQPMIERANGLYMPGDKIAYFFNDDSPEDTPETRADKLETMYHEVTHQLLGESRPGRTEVGEQANFWVIEGFPCYLESYRPEYQEPQVGNPRHIRIFWARKRALEENIYWPMRQFVGVGRSEFPLEADTYNQAAGMVHFFLNYEDGMYRDAFIQYLASVYDPAFRARQKSVSLEKILGVNYEDLDRQYLAYLRELPSDPPEGVQFIEVRQ